MSRTTEDDVTKALTGVDVDAIVRGTVQELPGMPPKPTEFFGVAVAEVEKALDRTRGRLAELRAKRAEINDEIRDLVEHEARLESMRGAAQGRKRGRAKE